MDCQQAGDNWSMITVHQMADVIRSKRPKVCINVEYKNLGIQ